MDGSKRNGWFLAAALLAAGGLAGWGISSYLSRAHGTDMSRTASVIPSAAVPAPEPAAPVVQPVALAPAPTACPFDPIVASGGSSDGQFVLASAMASQKFTDATPFLAVAEEAASAGRSRDAEVALIAACRVAAREGALTAPVADMQARLANHYAMLGNKESDATARAALLDRAGQLLDESFQGYTSALGHQASKTRMAQQRLAAFRQGALAPTTVASPVPDAVPPPNAGAAATMGAARLSLAERPLRRDENLTEVDGDLQRLYAQARSVSRDPAGMQRRQQQALAARQACRDEDCLRQWYAQRKRQLFDEF